MWASIIILVLYVMNLGIHLAKHNEPKGGKYNFWNNLISTAIILYLLYCAGAFDKLLIKF